METESKIVHKIREYPCKITRIEDIQQGPLDYSRLRITQWKPSETQSIQMSHKSKFVFFYLRLSLDVLSFVFVQDEFSPSSPRY